MIFAKIQAKINSYLIKILKFTILNFKKFKRNKIKIINMMLFINRFKIQKKKIFI